VNATPPNEPSQETLAAVGELCVAWSYVEMRTERTLWGIMGLTPQQGEAFLWRMPLLTRWQMIVREARKLYQEAEVDELKAIKKMVDTTQRDRNIVVHGVVHALMIADGDQTPGRLVGSVAQPPPFVRLPCWTIYMGDDAGKNFPVSPSAVGTIIDNARKIAELITAYNNRKGFTVGTDLAETVEEGWPVLL
jgi:hypothetical protein